MSHTKFLLCSMVMICASNSAAKTPLQFIDACGQIKGTVADIVQLLGIDLAVYRDIHSTLPTNHALHAYKFLQLFYQPEKEFYRKGGKASYEISHEQAQQIVQLTRGKYALLKTEDPSEKKSAPTIIFTGMPWSMEKRLHSFKKFLEAGYQCDTVIFCSRNQELEDVAKAGVETYKALFADIKVQYLQADHDAYDNFMLKLKPFLSKEFYLISDPEYALILQEACTLYGAQQGLTCLGVFMRPITDTADEYIRLDLKAYKYDEFISDYNEQLRAATYASLNILCYQLAREMKLLALP